MSFIVKERLLEELKILRGNMDTSGLRWEEILIFVRKMPSILHLRGKCRWKEAGADFQNIWKSECGLTWQLGDEDSPRQNRMYFCPQCGRYLKESRTKKE